MVDAAGSRLHHGDQARRGYRNNTKSNEEINPAQGDWAKVKRPLRSVSNQINGSALKYIFFTARQKDLYKEEEKNGKKELVRSA